MRGDGERVRGGGGGADLVLGRRTQGLGGRLAVVGRGWGRSLLFVRIGRCGLSESVIDDVL